jgi:aspartate racemase
MKTIGLIGGMSWESSLEYYRIINETVRERLGGLHSAKCLMVSVDFAEIEVLQRAGRWEEATQAMIAAARQVQAGGANFILICTNTMHKMAGEVQQHLDIPLLHIADPTAEKIKAQGLHKIGLLGTRFTMEEDFYKGRLHDCFGLDVVIPEPADRQIIHNVIYDELCLGKIEPASRLQFRRIMQQLADQGAQGIILGCTEISLLVDAGDTSLPLFDTTQIHAEAAVDLALA